MTGYSSRRTGFRYRVCRSDGDRLSILYEVADPERALRRFDREEERADDVVAPPILSQRRSTGCGWKRMTPPEIESLRDAVAATAPPPVIYAEASAA